MLRHSTLPLACLGLAFAMVVGAVPAPASAQDLSTQDQTVQDRLDRLERDLNMLQRQVYRGAPTPMNSDPNVAASEEIRLERLEQQMQNLTGRVEEYANQVTQLRQRIEQINSDMAVRESQGSGAPAAPPAADAEDNPPSSYGSETRRTAVLGGAAPAAVPPGSVVPAPSPGSGPQPIFGTLTPPGETPPAPAPGALPPQPRAPGMQNADRGPAGAPGRLPSGSPAQQYNYAFGLVKQADYADAETALRSFIAQHPRDPLTASAQYWLGETYYARAKYMDAASAFADGYKRFPHGPKAAEELLKLSMALGHANQKQNACVALAQLDHAFPNPGPTIRRAATEEKRHLGCG